MSFNSSVSPTSIDSGSSNSTFTSTSSSLRLFSALLLLLLHATKGMNNKAKTDMNNFLRIIHHSPHYIKCSIITFDCLIAQPLFVNLRFYHPFLFYQAHYTLSP